MKTLIKLLSCFLLGLSFSFVVAQTPKKVGDLPEGKSPAQRDRKAPRELQYKPVGNTFVSVNGKNRYTRALYGSHTLFRIETSDRPVFATYNKKINKHISFKLQVDDKIVPLDSTEYCKSVYLPGRRDYELKDTDWKNGALKVSVNAFYDKEGGVWKFDPVALPAGAWLFCEISEIKAAKLNRSGDMGVDPADAFDAPDRPEHLKRFKVEIKDRPVFVEFDNGELVAVESKKGEADYNKAETARTQLAGTLKIKTPDPYINTLGGVVSMAADGIWDGNVWLHGAVGWRMALPGWRAAYTGDVLGWHDRSTIHFDNYAASQVTDVPPVYPQPQQDTPLNLTRGVEKWGTPMYSNGYICRNPRNNKQMHHYDMNMVYIDELLWHLNWTGDLTYARKVFPVIKLSLEWEKRNWDADGDGLYDNYAGTWASDALMYNSGGTAVASAYNYRANRMAALIAGLIGEDPAPYVQEAVKIKDAMNNKLWLKDQGWWAEYVDFMGNKLVHPNAAVWSVYTPINAGVGTPFQAYQATRYIDEYIPHIPVLSKSFPADERYNTISSSSWMPYYWSVNNVAFGEVGNTALAYWQAGRPDKAYNLFKSAVLDGMYLGKSPGNIGQISYYDAALSENYRDFGDVVGVYSLDIVQGLFGIYPDALQHKLVIRPGFPSEWKFAEIQQRDIEYRFERKDNKDTYTIISRFKNPLKLSLLVNAPSDEVQSVVVNGQPVKWTIKDGINQPLIEIPCGASSKYDIMIHWSGKPFQFQTDLTKGVEQSFVKRKSGNFWWWQPVDPKTPKVASVEQNVLAAWDTTASRHYVQVNIDRVLNANVADIFKNRYLTPRSPYTTLQTPAQGVGEWCQPKLTYTIDDSGIRSMVKRGVLKTSIGIPFRMSENGENVAFTTLWDNYPDSISVPLSGKAKMACLLMTGTTGPMQYGVENGLVTVVYEDGTTDELVLKNPTTWCPIQEDYFTDGMAFSIDATRPYRVSFKTGIISRDMASAMGIPEKEVSRREIKGGAGVILGVPLDKTKELKSIQWKSVANEVIVGMMGITLVQ